MHAALASDTQDPDFAPEPFHRPQMRRSCISEMLAQADIAFQVLRLKAGRLTRASSRTRFSALKLESEVRERFSRLQQCQHRRSSYSIPWRLSSRPGALHRQDFMIIDFEGEPARPLSERRDKTICLRDVAGMVRSFQYAGYASLFGQVAGLPTGNLSRSSLTLRSGMPGLRQST